MNAKPGSVNARPVAVNARPEAVNARPQVGAARPLATKGSIPHLLLLSVCLFITAAEGSEAEFRLIQVFFVEFVRNYGYFCHKMIIFEVFFVCGSRKCGIEEVRRFQRSLFNSLAFIDRMMQIEGFAKLSYKNEQLWRCPQKSW